MKVIRVAGDETLRCLNSCHVDRLLNGEMGMIMGNYGFSHGVGWCRER